MNFDREPWRKLYLRESLDQQAWPLFTRALRDFFIRIARDDGTLLARTRDPGPDLARALRARSGEDVAGCDEASSLCDAVRHMLVDGYLSHEKGRLFITNLEIAQARAQSSAERTRAWRTRNAAESPNAVTLRSDDGDNVTGTGLSHDPIRSDPKRSNTDPPDPPTKPKPRAKLKRSASRTEPRDETELQIAWRVWRELWTERYRAKYVDSGLDAKVIRALSLSALRQAKERIAETDAAGGQLLELIEAVIRHWFTAYLAEAGHKDFLVNARHALRHAERDLAKYGLPWSKVLIRAADGSFACPYPESDTRCSWWDARIGYDFSWMRELPGTGYNDFSDELEERVKAGPMTVEWYEQRRKELGV